ncbi:MULTISPECIES: dihydrofolate reductase [Edaphosphingomonas]|uniref:Dihydrofolate reductase n=2 Tax=Edaphosphingomonas TaxID=3423724 RepID=A0A2T4HT61_9SPHN|nr:MULTISPECIES: dihydrofolate reductase [Sphingomonas]OHT22264.1 Dihydrofolate reductase type 3 [Sphingomonas haloaromaticamans]PTD18999.1 dihydrofolate reductase [Sphingomonas fennica]
MSRPRITFYVARADNGVIGRDGRLPWRLPEDLKRFKAMTMGKPMVMGRKTFESFPKPLPGRRHIVLTRDPAWAADGAEVAHSVDQAIALAGDVEEVAVIGGAEIYALFMPQADRIELTEVHRTVEGDTKMPPLGAGWRVANREMGGPDFDFVTIERNR